MQLIQNGVAGTMESGDILIELQGAIEGGIEIDLQSTVSNQFGRQIRDSIKQTLEAHNIRDARVRAVDKGALDCTVQARVKAAIYRAADCEAPSFQ